MPLLKKPFLSFSAFGRLGKLFTVRRRKRDHILENIPFPTDARSPAQLIWRTMYQACTSLWHDLSIVERQQWESSARPLHMTGYAWFISQCLKPNPGIYLPLAGGTMTGDIDMDANKIEDLPAPVAASEPTRKAELDAHEAANTGVHGVAASYLAKAAGSQYTALNRAGDTGMGRDWIRGVSDDYMYFGAGAWSSAAFRFYGRDHASLAGYVLFNVPNAAKDVGLIPLAITGATDDPDVIPWNDNKFGLGTAAKRWKTIFGVTITEGDHGFMDKECAVCHNPLNVGDPLIYKAMSNHPETLEDEPNIVKKLHDPSKPATHKVKHFNEWTGKYTDEVEPVIVKVKRDHYREVLDVIVKEEIEVDEPNEYEEADGVTQVVSPAYLVCKPICKKCFLTTPPV